MKKYYYSDGKQQIGPLSKEELQSKGISKETLVWYEGLTEWTKAGDVEELVDLFPNEPTSPPMPEQKTATPPPMPENNTVTPPPMPQQDDINAKSKTKSKKKTLKRIGVIVGCIIMALVAITIIEYVQHIRYWDTIESEKNVPRLYLTIVDAKLNDNILSGCINSSAKYRNYHVVQIKLSYYDKKGNVIQNELCNINGPFNAGVSTPFKIKVNRPNLWNYFSADSFNVEITSVPY